MSAPLSITSEDMIALHELIDEQRAIIREFAETTGSHGSWGAVRSLESAMYYVWGAVGYLAQSEGRLGPNKAEPEAHIQNVRLGWEGPSRIEEIPEEAVVS